jgi:hypothetical protein
MEHFIRRIQAFQAATADPASPLSFTPVPVRPRLDGWTADRQRLFVAVLAATGRSCEAARVAGMTEQSAARLRRRPDARSFTRACATASAIAKHASARAAADRSKVRQGSEGSKGFFPRGSTPSEPSARDRPPPRLRRPADRPKLG